MAGMKIILLAGIKTDNILQKTGLLNWKTVIQLCKMKQRKRNDFK